MADESHNPTLFLKEGVRVAIEGCVSTLDFFLAQVCS